MAGPNVGYATLQIMPSMRGVQGALASQLGGPSDAAGKAAGARMGGGMLSSMQGVLKKGLVGVGAVAVLGVGLEKIASGFDDAFDTIRVGTGATGDTLAGLEASFKNVFKSVPTDMGSASTAIADLNTRLGLTGVPLERLSTQILELSRITKTDLGSNIESVTRVFGDWGITVDDQAERLDQLFRASQATGIGVDTLSQQMVKFGAPLRQLGFDFETTAGLLGKFEKEGVNAELVMGSMRIALGKMARDGEPAEETLKRVTDEIKNAGSASEANALALELFGARAGPDMAAAIREGRFELGDLYDTIASGEETILGAAESTNDWRESWTKFKNNVLVALEPIATRLFDALGRGMDWVIEKAPEMQAWFEENIKPTLETVWSFIETTLLPTLGKFADWFVNSKPAIQTTIALVGTGLVSAFVAYAWSAATAAAATLAATWPLWAAVAVAAALASAMDWAYRSFSWFRDIVNWYVGVGIRLWRWAIDAAGWIADLAGKIWGAVSAVWALVGALRNLPSVGGGIKIAGVRLPIPGLAAGGIVPATDGGRLALIGEGGRDEAVVPLPHDWQINGGAPMGGGHLVVDVRGGTDDLVRLVQKWVRTQGGGNVQVLAGA